MRIVELFLWEAEEGNHIYIKAAGTVWEGFIDDIDEWGVTVEEEEGKEWISYNDLEDWGRIDGLTIKINGVEHNCSY